MDKLIASGSRCQKPTTVVARRATNSESFSYELQTNFHRQWNNWGFEKPNSLPQTASIQFQPGPDRSRQTMRSSSNYFGHEVGYRQIGRVDAY